MKSLSNGRMGTNKNMGKKLKTKLIIAAIVAVVAVIAFIYVNNAILSWQ